MPRVSVIVPIYNSAIPLVRCIESIRRQRFADIEIMLVNDGSQDASPEICRMYERLDERIVFIDKENGGVSHTRNVAIERARGDYLQFVDADDYLDENATRLLVERMDETQADMVISHFCRVSGERVTVQGFLDTHEVLSQKQLAMHLMDEPASFYYGVMWNKLYRRKVIMQNDIRCNESLGWCEDMLFNLEYIRYAHRFAALQTPIYYYVKNVKGITATSLSPARIVSIKSRLFPYYKELYEDLGLYEQNRLAIYKYLVAVAHDEK